MRGNNNMKIINEYKNGNNFRRQYETKTKNGNNLVIEISTTEHDKNFIHSLMRMWVKNGCVKEFLTRTLNVKTYCFDKKDVWLEKYNPQIIENTNQLNFEYMLEATEENERLLLNEVVKRANE